MTQQEGVAADSQIFCDLAWLGGPDATAGVLLSVDADGRISSLATGLRQPPSGALHLHGLVTPGLVNAHSHAFHRALRARSEGGQNGSFWTWREQMYAAAQQLQPDTYRDLATACFAEMVLSGITTVGEFHYLHHDTGGRPYASDAMGEAILEAASQAGIRITLLDTIYLHAGIGQEPEGVQTRFSDGTVESWAARVESLQSSGPARSPLVKVGASVHSVRAVDPASIGGVAWWAANAGAVVHAHVSEQPAENEQCLAAYSKSPTEVLAESGVISPRFCAVHATHLSESDIKVLGDSRVHVCMCPTTERDLADGIGPADRLRSRGAGICLGSDSHAVIDLWEEARAVELDQRLGSLVRGTHSAQQLLSDATARGAAALGWEECGALAVGRQADLVALDLEHPRLAGTVDPSGAGAASAAVFAATAGTVTDVVVAGRQVVRDRHHLRIASVGRALAASVRAAIGAI